MSLFGKKEDKEEKSTFTLQEGQIVEVEHNDIDVNEISVQDVVNTDNIKELTEDATVENENAEEVTEGIGAEEGVGSAFNMRTSKPGAGNKFFITRSAGGYSQCIVGSPTDAQCNVLANCVGYACGRFNEIIGEMKYPTLNCNAENFIERAIAAGLSIANKPSLGGIMVWQKGATLGYSDGAGHVAVVERIDGENQIYTSESGYGSSAFWNSTRNNSNGRWGLGSGYTFRGCIVNPVIGYKPYEPTPEPKPEPTPSDKFNIGDKVVINGDLFVNANAANASGHVDNKVTTITRKAEGTAHPYNTEGDLGWMNESSISSYVEPAPTPTPTPEPARSINVGSQVKINIKSSGYSASADGTARGGRTYTAANGWVRYVLAIHEGQPFPYQVGLGNITTGFFKEEDLELM